MAVPPPHGEDGGEPAAEIADAAIAGDDDLRTRIANLERFAHRLAHELGTPLTTARGFASVMLARDDLPPQVRDGLERIERAAATAEARLQARLGEAVGEGPRPVRLRAVLRDVVSTLPEVADEAVIEVPNDVRVFGEPAVLRTIVENVVSVLAERALSGSGRAGLRVASMGGPGDAETVRFEVDAPSLTPEEERLIGDPAQAVEGSPQVPGLGRLGAASGMIAGQGGKLWLTDPTSTSGRLALLLQFPRAIDGPSAQHGGPSEG